MDDLFGWKPVQEMLTTELPALLKTLVAAKAAPAEALQAFRAADPLVSAVTLALLLAVAVWLLSLPTNNHSWVDKIWSIAPVYFIWHFAFHDGRQLFGGASHPRILIMAAIATIWGSRLTYNFYRKGGYAWEGEDYRWPILRASMHPALFQLFNLTFISFAQPLLLLAFSGGPAYVAWQYRGTPLNLLDLLAAALCAGALAIEATADQQQWVFQEAKHAKLRAGKRLTGAQAKGFVTSGLWSFSRHPNFFAEQSLWWSMALFAFAAGGGRPSWALGGAALLSLLFHGSTNMTERITAAKYPAYKEYQATTSRLIPWFPSALPKKRAARVRSATKAAAAPAKEAAPKPGQEPVTPRAKARPASEEEEAPTTRRRTRAARGE